MLLSKDEAAIWLNISEASLVVFGAILTLGIIGEYREHERWLWKSLVIIGVSGELIGDGGVLVFSHRLQQIEGYEISQLDIRSTAALHNANAAIRKAKAASDEANSAKLESGNAKDLAGQASTLATNARKHVASLGTDVAAVKERANDLTAKLVEANRKVDEELDARVKLEAQLINVEVCNAPRVIPSWSANGKTSVDPLKPLAGAVVFIEFVADNEARRAAWNIAGTLVAAKWDVRPLKVVNELKDGVDVQPYQGSHQGSMRADIGEVWKADDIADVLVDFLHSYNWQVQRGWPTDSMGKMIRDDKVLPPGSIRIQVGLYPAVIYIPPPGATELSVALAKSREETEKAEEESRRRMEEQIRRSFDSLPPDQRKIAEQRAKEFEENRKKLMSRYTNPCRSFLTWSPPN